MNVFLSLPLSGRSALVTGVSRRGGIGFAIAKRLSELGASLFIQSWRNGDHERSSADADLDALSNELRSPDQPVHCQTLDFADPESPSRLVEEATSALGHVDILVVNHARSSCQALEELTAEELDLTFQVNCRASLLLIKEWAATHDDSRDGARVILMTSGQHLAPMPSEMPYALSKAALHHVTGSLATHLAPRGITVNAVNPGPTDTGWADEQTRSRVLERMPFGRWGHPDDAARLVSWLATDDAQWITGQVIDSEGGFRR